MKIAVVLFVILFGACAFENANMPKCINAVSSDSAMRAHLATIQVKFIGGMPLCGGAELGKDLRFHNAYSCYHPPMFVRDEKTGKVEYVPEFIEVALIDWDLAGKDKGSTPFRYQDQIEDAVIHELKHAKQWKERHQTWHPVDKLTPPDASEK